MYIIDIVDDMLGLEDKLLSSYVEWMLYRGCYVGYLSFLVEIVGLIVFVFWVFFMGILCEMFELSVSLGGIGMIGKFV